MAETKLPNQAIRDKYLVGRFGSSEGKVKRGNLLQGGSVEAAA